MRTQVQEDVPSLPQDDRLVTAHAVRRRDTQCRDDSAADRVTLLRRISEDVR